MELKGIGYSLVKKLLKKDEKNYDIRKIKVLDYKKTQTTVGLTFKYRPTPSQIKKAKQIIEENSNIFKKEFTKNKRNYRVDFEGFNALVQDKHIIKLLIANNFDVDKSLDYIKRIVGKSKKELDGIREGAKKIIEENALKYKGDEFVGTDVGLYHFGDNSYIYHNNSGDYAFEEEEIMDALIRNNLNLDKSIDFLIKETRKRTEESAIQEEMDRIERRKDMLKIREKAEKRLYGKVKTKREGFTEEERDMILNKFGNKCIICGNEEGLHIHHKDGDPKNNQMNNIIVLCGVCHKKIHMKVR